MLRLERPELHPAVAKALDEMSASFAKTTSPGWDAFRAGRVRRQWKVFAEVWTTLCATGFEKCALCESPHPATVEHIVPKGATRGRALVFAWSNLLPACDTCNRARENSRVAELPIDPTSREPLDVLGWDEHGEFTPRPGFESLVEGTVRAYGLQRFKTERADQLRRIRFLLALSLREDPLRPETEERLRGELRAEVPWLGPVREYILRPPSKGDASLVRHAFERHPWLREVVAPWLRPASWATGPWGA